jgi:hypothetical protein
LGSDALPFGGFRCLGGARPFDRPFRTPLLAPVLDRRRGRHPGRNDLRPIELNFGILTLERSLCFGIEGTASDLDAGRRPEPIEDP